MEMKTEFFLEHECALLENKVLKLLITQSIGPRILWFGFKGGENLFAELPDFVTKLPTGDVFHFYGGHRLWQAPEDFNTTYISDDDPVEIAAIENGLSIVQKTQPTGLQKSVEVVLSGKSQVTITHHFTNLGNSDITCALWAITQFKTGGVAILPQANSDTGVLPNRTLTLWPYTDMTDPNVHWGNNYILVNANMTAPFKIGFPNPRGWQAYWLNGTVFIKHAVYQAQAEYYDYGSSSESYCNDQFIELETLAPIGRIPPGNTATHVETWNLYKDIDCPQNETDAQALAEKLGLT